jgi:hypothetical protein
MRVHGKGLSRSAAAKRPITGPAWSACWLQRRDVAQGVDTAFDWIIVWIEGLAARRLARVGLHDEAADVEADGLRVRAGREDLPDGV